MNKNKTKCLNKFFSYMYLPYLMLLLRFIYTSECGGFTSTQRQMSVRPGFHFHPLLFSSPSVSERRGGPGDLQQQGQPSGPAQEAQEGSDGLHGPPAGPAGAQLRAAKVPERAGPHGAGGLPQPHRHAGQDLVPEPEVKTTAGIQLKRDEGG